MSLPFSELGTAMEGRAREACFPLSYRISREHALDGKKMQRSAMANGQRLGVGSVKRLLALVGRGWLGHAADGAFDCSQKPRSGEDEVTNACGRLGRTSSDSRGEARFTTWMTRIVMNAVPHALRHERRSRLSTGTTVRRGGEVAAGPARCGKS